MSSCPAAFLIRLGFLDFDDEDDVELGSAVSKGWTEGDDPIPVLDRLEDFDERWRLPSSSSSISWIPVKDDFP